MTMTDDTPQKLEIDWFRTTGGALAAVSSAVLLSTLGAAGTIIGAALGSVIATVGGALYSQGLVRSRQRLVQAQGAALRKVGVAQAEVRRAGRRQGGTSTVDAHLAHAQATLDDAKGDLDALSDEAAGTGWRARLALLPWKRIALVAAGLFALAVVAITAFELVVGRSVSEITTGSQGGGSTISHVVGGGTNQPSRDQQTPPADPASPSATPSQAPSEQANPSSGPAGAPSATPSAEPTGSPTPSVTPTPAPGASAPAPSATPGAGPGAPAATAPPAG